MGIPIVGVVPILATNTSSQSSIGRPRRHTSPFRQKEMPGENFFRILSRNALLDADGHLKRDATSVFHG